MARLRARQLCRGPPGTAGPMNERWQPQHAAAPVARLPPLPRPSRDPAVVDFAKALGPPPSGRRFKLFGQQEWSCSPGHRGADVPRLKIELQGLDPSDRRAHSVGGMSRSSSRRSVRPSPTEGTQQAAPSEPGSSRRAASSKTLRAIRAVYRVPTPEGDPDGKLRPASPETEALELGGPEAQERNHEALRQQLRAMRTGDDAVAYFTRHGANTKVKLIHCVLASSVTRSSRETLSPYDLLVISEERIQREMEHFTITPSGVVHVMPGQLSECVSLSEWVHQCMMYRVLKSMNFFRLYAHSKAIQQWRRNARDAAFCRKRGRLARNCFWSRPILTEHMLRVKGLTSEVGASPMLSLPDRCVRLEEFETLAQCVKPELTGGKRQELERTREAVVETLEGLIAAVRKGMDAVNLRRSTTSFAQSRTRSLAQEKLETKERLRMEQILHEDEMSLSSCIRLADCMLQANLVTSITCTAEDLYHRVDAGSGEQKKKLFAITARLGSQEVLLEPSRERFLEVFHETYKDLTGLADAVLPVLAAPALAAHRPSFDGLVPMPRLLTRHRPWVFYMDSTLKKLTSQLREAQQLAAETYGPFRKIFEYKNQWNKEAFKRQSHSIESLSKEVALMVQFQDSLSKFRVQRHVGVLAIEGRQLRDDLQTVPSTVLTSIWPLMQQNVRSEGVRVSERLEKLNQELDERPSKVSALEAYSHVLEVADDEELTLEASVEQIQGAHRLLRTHGVRLLSDDHVLLERLLTQLQEFSSASLPAAKGFLAQKRREQRLLASEELAQAPSGVASLEMMTE